MHFLSDRGRHGRHVEQIATRIDMVTGYSEVES
jgi:hypothetical protein